MFQIKTVRCPEMALANDYPTKEIPGGKIIAWNKKPEKKENFLIFVVLWNNGKIEIFRKSPFRPKTLKIFQEGAGLFSEKTNQAEIDKAKKERKLFPYIKPIA